MVVVHAADNSVAACVGVEAVAAPLFAGAVGRAAGDGCAADAVIAAQAGDAAAVLAVKEETGEVVAPAVVGVGVVVAADGFVGNWAFRRRSQGKGKRWCFRQIVA